MFWYNNDWSNQWCYIISLQKSCFLLLNKEKLCRISLPNCQKLGQRVEHVRDFLIFCKYPRENLAENTPTQPKILESSNTRQNDNLHRTQAGGVVFVLMKLFFVLTCARTCWLRRRGGWKVCVDLQGYNEGKGSEFDIECGNISPMRDACTRVSSSVTGAVSSSLEFICSWTALEPSCSSTECTVTCLSE